MSMRKRDHAYYLGRLEKEFPDFHLRFLAGEFKSASEALRAAGIRKPPKVVNDLLRA